MSCPVEIVVQMAPMRKKTLPRNLPFEDVPLPILFEDVENMAFLRETFVVPLEVDDFKTWAATQKKDFRFLQNCFLRACLEKKTDLVVHIINESMIPHLLTFPETLASCFVTADKELFFDLLEFLLRFRCAVELSSTDEDQLFFLDNEYGGGAKMFRGCGILHEFIPRSVKFLLKHKDSVVFYKVIQHLDFAIGTAFTLLSRRPCLDEFILAMSKFGKKYISTKMFSSMFHNTNFYRHGPVYNAETGRRFYFEIISLYVPKFFWHYWLQDLIIDRAGRRDISFTSIEHSVAKTLCSLS